MRRRWSLQTITHENFRQYGRILPLDLSDFVARMRARESVPEGEVIYEASVPDLEKMALFHTLQQEVFGGIPTELGHCSGWNHKLNGLEYHRSSEIDLAATDLVLMLGRQQDIDWDTYTYDTSKVECFRIPAGTAVELYATTLHFAPGSVGYAEFRMGVALPRGTNETLAEPAAGSGENRLLMNKNKWLLAHEESGLQKQGAWIGLRGENITV